MNITPSLELVTKNVVKKIYTELCDNPMSSPSCLYYLEQTKKEVINDIIQEISTIPEHITMIKMVLPPSDLNLAYYNFLGINTILFNLFSTENQDTQEELMYAEAFLNIYYSNDPLYSIPQLNIDVGIFQKLSSPTESELWKKLRDHLLLFTGRIGDIDVIKVNSISHLKEMMKTPLLIGCPKFDHNPALKYHGIERNQLKEMNCIHLFCVEKLRMSNVVNNTQLNLFEEYEIMLYLQDEKIIDDVIDAWEDDIETEQEGDSNHNNQPF